MRQKQIFEAAQEKKCYSQLKHFTEIKYKYFLPMYIFEHSFTVLCGINEIMESYGIKHQAQNNIKMENSNFPFQKVL